MAHTLLNISLPEGEGTNLSITIIVANQTGTTNMHYLTYAAPIVGEIITADESIGYPPSGCKFFEELINKNPKSIGLACSVRASVFVLGKNFGRYGKSVLTFLDASLTIRVATISNSSHNLIEAYLEEGVGTTKISVSTPGASSDVFDKISNMVSFAYNKPKLHGMVFGVSLDVAIISDTIDAQGGFKSGNSRLFLLGEHFGETETALEIFIGGQRCIGSKHHGWSQTESLLHSWQNSGRPYVSCIPQETTIGEKEIFIKIAKTSTTFTSPRGEQSISKIYARCFNGYYGKIGELCVECWYQNPKSLYSERERKLYLSECPGTFKSDVGVQEPLAKAGFALLPPPECFEGDCLFDGITIADKIGWIPSECMPLAVDSILVNPSGALVLYFFEDHQFSNGVEINVITRSENMVGMYGEQRYAYLTEVIGSNSIQMISITDAVFERNMSLFASTATYVALASCDKALSAGEICHPNRYNGTLAVGGGNDRSDFDSRSNRRICPYMMPCEPPAACIRNSTCSDGYITYYDPYRDFGSSKICNQLHYTLPDGRCFAPRCGMCDISEFSPHFRLDGVCVPCPAIPWLLPAIMAFALLIGGGTMLIFAKSKVTRNVLRIGVDYFQILAIFRTAKVAWPLEISLFLKYFQLFQMDIDLVGPECSFRSIMTYETKFYFKVTLPLLGGAFLAVFYSILSLISAIYRCTKARTAASSEKRVTSEQSYVAVVVSVTTSMMYFLYLQTCRAGFDILNCQDTIPQTGKLYMVAEPLEECYKPGGLQAKLLPYAYLVLLIYGFGFPMSVGLLFLLFKKKIAADQKLNVHDKGGTSLSNPNYAFRRSCGQLYGVFQPRFYLWSIFLIVRKLLLCAISVMFKENPTYQLAGTLAVVFAAFVLQVKNMPFLDVKERARLMREEAEQKILDEILRLERQSLLVRVNGSSYSKIMHTMRMQIEDQEKIMSKHRNDHFNL